VAITEDTFARALRMPEAVPPAAAGTRQRQVLTGLQPETTYYVAIRAVNDAGVVSALSNVLEVRTGKP
jgi:hypothetical protein